MDASHEKHCILGTIIILQNAPQQTKVQLHSDAPSIPITNMMVPITYLLEKIALALGASVVYALYSLFHEVEFCQEHLIIKFEIKCSCC